MIPSKWPAFMIYKALHEHHRCAVLWLCWSINGPQSFVLLGYKIMSMFQVTNIHVDHNIAQLKAQLMGLEKHCYTGCWIFRGWSNVTIEAHLEPWWIKHVCANKFQTILTRIVTYIVAIIIKPFKMLVYTEGLKTVHNVISVINTPKSVSKA